MSTGSVFLYLAAMNIVGVAIMWWDKFRARTGGWRVPEKTLIGVAAIGGSLGVFAGMRWFRHKTQHAKFYLGVPAIIVMQLALAGYYLLQNQFVG